MLSSYEWHGPFKYKTDGEAFEYKGKRYLTKEGRRREVGSRAFNVVYEDDELYARKIRSDANRAFDGYDFQIFDELPEGWHRGINEYGGRRGIRGRYDSDSAYEWCETDIPMYRNAYPGDSRRNREYRQGLVRRAK